MAKKMLIDATHPEETRVVVADGTRVEDFDFETVNKRQLAGNIYLAKVTRVEPSLQAAFVEYGGNRHGFLAFAEIHPDYYQIPVADREALLAEEEEQERRAQAEEEQQEAKKSKSRRRRRSSAQKAETEDQTVSAEIAEEATASESTEAEASGDGSDVSEADNAPAPQEDATDEAPSDEAQAEAASVEDNANDEDASEPEAPAVSNAAPEASSSEDAEEANTDAEPNDADDETDAAEERSESRTRRQRARRYKIQEVIKVRQVLLVQVVKEERGNKGAALTTYLSLAGRYCVLMPNTARGGGISRKITTASDRKKLKDIAHELEVPKGAGLIIRTAGAKRTKTEIKRDYEFLIRQWDQVRELTMKSVAPELIYEEGSLIKRSIRDLYGRDIDEIQVEGVDGYREAKEYMKMLMPSHAKNVKPYTDPTPLFSKHQVENTLSGMFNPTVQLKSGGYIVIGVTEALVAVDVNSGRATKEGSIEETATKTNLEAADEVARQVKLRDLAGLIVIDFIDMDERRNNTAVEKRMKDALKNDRARIQVGRISSFGLMEMSRQRLRPGMIEMVTQPCPHCQGTGLVRSDGSLALSILRDVQEEATKQRCQEIVVSAPVAVINYLINFKREAIALIEARFGIAIRVEADVSLDATEYKLERNKTASRALTAATSERAVQMDATYAELHKEAEAEEAAAAAAGDDDDADESDDTGSSQDAEHGDDQPKKRRRRRRGGRRRKKSDEDETDGENGTASDETSSDTEAAPTSEEGENSDSEKPRKRRSRSRSRKPHAETSEDGLGPVIEGDTAEGDALVEVPEAKSTETPKEAAPQEVAAISDAATDTEEEHPEVAKAEPVAQAAEVEAPAPVAETEQATAP
ncbi:MAG: Rne/Rng family ribonuclease, partial [Pseudomonadota bacterium]